LSLEVTLFTIETVSRAVHRSLKFKPTNMTHYTIIMHAHRDRNSIVFY